MKKIGIYRITNTQTLEIYVGSSQDIDYRWRRHRWNLRRGDHPNRYLQRAWMKYGPDSFVFDIVENCDVRNLLGREKYYIDTESPQYNIASEPSSPMKGRKHTDESKMKISIGCTGLTREVSDDTRALLRHVNVKNGHNKPVEAIDPVTGEVRHRFETIGDVASKGWKKSAVIRCCKGKMQSYQGFLWKYESSVDLTRNHSPIPESVRAKISAGRKGKTHTAEVREKIAQAHEWRSVASFNPNTGEIVKIYERMRAVEDDGFAQCRVWVCCQGPTKKGKIPKHGGLGWKYLT